ncbi:phage tail tape measure tp901 core region [Lasius niger]|uniref:Phage tail tape measure tp901 core region n=1 Tax=Lasius niger TaxID=67767 RepID=A0A0J7K9M0_LASNI|nr:phage tail tape measure tp901 core region [Lasius niger]
MITRKQLEAYTLLKLQEELHRLGVTNPPNIRDECIEKMLNLSKKKVPSKDSTESQVREAGKSPSMPSTSALTSSTATSSLLDGASNQNQQIPTSEVMLTQLCALLSVALNVRSVVLYSSCRGIAVERW